MTNESYGSEEHGNKHVFCPNVALTTTPKTVLDLEAPLLLDHPLAWGKLDRQPATGYLLGQVTMPWFEKQTDIFLRI